MDFKIDDKLDELDHRIRLAKKTLVDLRSLGETSRELSLVMTKLEEAEHWLKAHRGRKEAGCHENA